MRTSQDLAGTVPLQRLADDAPHGFLKRAMFEALAEHGVPEPRAAWFVKLIYFGRHRCFLDNLQPPG